MSGKITDNKKIIIAFVSRTLIGGGLAYLVGEESRWMDALKVGAVVGGVGSLVSQNLVEDYVGNMVSP